MTAEKGAGSIRSGSDLKYERTIAELRIVARQSDDARHTAVNALSDQMSECGCRMCSARRSPGVA